ncbi:hypothetical protein [Peribacillus loiseleuriae]|uniref:hypothetical protein n=1 Tax=Peribacillus loiseleuriae TaxID=1679170 RepID=UPI003D07FEAD
MERVIQSVTVVSSVRARFVLGQNKVDDIVEKDGVYKLYNENHELIYEIKNCPVLVSYKEA